MTSNNFDVILADPPWRYRVWNRPTAQKRTAESHYPTMSIEELCKLDVGSLAANNAALFLWTTWPAIFEAQEVIKAWGFTYKTLAWEWVKLNSKWLGNLSSVIDIDTFNRLIFFGMGYYSRANCEPCLLAVKGRMPVKDRAIRNVLFAENSQHSRKPEKQYELIQRLYPGRRYLELFARQERPGWEVWGNEVESGVEVLEVGNGTAVHPFERV